MLGSLKRQPQRTEMPKAISSPVISWPPKDPILRRGLLWECSETQMNRDVTTLGEILCTWAKQGASPLLSTNQNQVGMRRQKWVALPQVKSLPDLLITMKIWVLGNAEGSWCCSVFFPSFWGKIYWQRLSIFSKFNFFLSKAYRPSDRCWVDFKHP